MSAADRRSRAGELDEDFKDVCCPHCDSNNIILVSLFGSSVSEVMFRCLQCRTFFNWVKWQGRLPASPAVEPDANEEPVATVAGSRSFRH